MNILIVDDEISSIEALQKNINWERVNVTSIYTALSMNEAIEQLSYNKIDILLSDIEMPMGTGLQLLQWIKDNNLNIECIFMTCHADFSYAQQAIQLGSLDYILKPLSYDVVERVIQKAINKIKKESDEKKNSGAWLENKGIISKQFWKDFFVGEISPDKESLQKYIQSKNISIDLEKNYIPVLISVKKIDEELGTAERKLINKSLKLRIEERLVVEHVPKERITFDENSILVIFQVEKTASNGEITESIKAGCEQLIQEIEQELNMIVCCYIGMVDTIYSIPNQIEKMQKIDFNNVSYTKYVHLLQNYKHYHIEYKNSIFIEWKELIIKSKFDVLLVEIKRMLTSKETIDKIDRKFLQNFYQDYIYLLITFTSKQNVFLNELFGDDNSRRVFDKATTSLADLLICIETTTNTMQEFFDRNENVMNPVEKTQKYIQEHIAEEITMEGIAINVHLNADYLTRIFKKELGVSINKYIINHKMQIAKELLVETDKSIGEIAMEVGYLNYSSFNKIFTKVVETSPQEYKRMHKK